MKNKNLLDRIVELITQKQRKAIFLTLLFGAILFIALIICYIILIYFKIAKFEVETLAQLIATGICVPTFVTSVIQISNYLYHSKYEIKLNKKASSVKIAEQYANQIICETSFVHNVLLETLGDKELKLLRSKIPDHFNATAYEKLGLSEDVENIFRNGKTGVTAEVIRKNCFISKIFCGDFADFQHIKDDELDKEFTRRFRGNILFTLNLIEWFSIEINENIAEEEVLYNPIHHTFLQFIEEIYPIICLHNNKTEESLYVNTIKLYRRWKAKKEDTESQLLYAYFEITKSDDF